MNTHELIIELTAAGVLLRARGAQLVIDAPAGALTPELRQQLAEHKPELLELLAPAGNVEMHDAPLWPAPPPPATPTCRKCQAPMQVTENARHRHSWCDTPGCGGFDRWEAILPGNNLVGAFGPPRDPEIDRRWREDLEILNSEREEIPVGPDDPPEWAEYRRQGVRLTRVVSKDETAGKASAMKSTPFSVQPSLAETFIEPSRSY